MDYPGALFYGLSTWGVALAAANIFKTIYGKNFCDKHEAVQKDILNLTENKILITRLLETNANLEKRMIVSEADRAALHLTLKKDFGNATSWFGDIKLILDVMCDNLIKEEAVKTTISKILKRKEVEDGRI